MDHPLRKPCRCGSKLGYITEVGAQDTVRCTGCDTFQYNAPRTETGKAVRSVRSTPHVASSKRNRVLADGGHCCVSCGRRPPEIQLHMGHLISVDEGKREDIPDDLIFHDFNLAAFCDECNLGLGRSTVAVHLMYRCLLARIKQSEQF